MHAWVSESMPEMRLRTAGICLWVISLWVMTWRAGRLLAGTELHMYGEERMLALPTSDSFPRPVIRFQPSKTLVDDRASQNTQELTMGASSVRRPATRAAWAPDHPRCSSALVCYQRARFTL